VNETQQTEGTDLFVALYFQKYPGPRGVFLIFLHEIEPRSGENEPQNGENENGENENENSLGPGYSRRNTREPYGMNKPNLCIYWIYLYIFFNLLSVIIKSNRIHSGPEVPSNKIIEEFVQLIRS